MKFSNIGSAHLQILLGLAMLCLFAPPSHAQDKVKNFLLLGVDTAEELTSDFTAPVTEGLLYALTGGWYHSAQVQDPWTVDLALITNGSFVPSDKRSFVIDFERFENLKAKNGDSRAIVPTILGGSNNIVTMIASLDGEEFEFDSPSGMSLLDLNLLPSAFLQVGVSMPGATEVRMRWFPRIEIQNQARIGLVGFGVQHEFSRWINAFDEAPFALSAFVAFTSLYGDYAMEQEGLVLGSNQKIDAQLDSWLVELLASTTFPVFNVYTGMGYVHGRSEIGLTGTYIINTQRQQRILEDPFSITSKIGGFRANIGVLVKIGWFSINTDYTFQGYNNFSLGLNFTLN